MRLDSISDLKINNYKTLSTTEKLKEEFDWAVTMDAAAATLDGKQINEKASFSEVEQLFLLIWLVPKTKIKPEVF